jgi:hypothetical protein
MFAKSSSTVVGVREQLVRGTQKSNFNFFYLRVHNHLQVENHSSFLSLLFLVKHTKTEKENNKNKTLF